MKRNSILFVFLLISLIGISQRYTNPNPGTYGYQYNRLMPDSTLHIPTICGTPSGKISLKDNVYNKSAIIYDSCNKVLYAYSPKDSSWYMVGNSLSVDTTAFHIGGDSTGKYTVFGTKDNHSIHVMTNGNQLWTFDTAGKFGYTGGTWYIDQSGGANFNTVNSSAVYPSSYLSLPDTNRNVAYGLIGSHNGSLFAQIGSGQYFRQILMAKDSSLYTTPTQLALKLNKSDSSLRTGYVTPTVLTNDSTTLAVATALKLNKSNFIDSLTGRNATLLGNTTTGSGSTIVLSGSPTITLPNIAAVNVSGGILSFPTGSSGTVALRGDTGTYFYPYSTNPKNYIGLTSLSATRNVSTGSIFTYNSATGAYNLDTTKLQTLSANAPISIVSNVIKADTISRYGGLATIGKTYNDSTVLAASDAKKLDTTITRIPYSFIGRKSGSGIWSQQQFMDSTWWNGAFATQVRAAQNNSTGLTGSGTVSSALVPLPIWSTSNSVLSSTGNSYLNWDTTNHALNIGNSTQQSSYMLAIGNINTNNSGIQINTSNLSSRAINITSTGSGNFYAGLQGINSCKAALLFTGLSINSYLSGVGSTTAGSSNSVFTIQDISGNNPLAISSYVGSGNGTFSYTDYRLLNLYADAGTNSNTKQNSCLNISSWFLLYNTGSVEGSRFGTVLLNTNGNTAIYETGFVWQNVVLGSLAERMRLSGTNLLINTSTDDGVNLLQVAGRTKLNGQVSFGGSTPTIAAGTGAGTSPTVTISGTNNGGIVNVTTGTLPTASATVVTITYTGSFATGSEITLYPANAATALLSGVSMVYTSGNTTTFTITAGTTALTAATAYSWNYNVTGY